MPGAFGKGKNLSRAAIVAVVLFLVFDFAALALNFWLSWKIEKQAVAINLAGRQRMLSQRMAKVLLQLEIERHETTSHAGPGPAGGGGEVRALLDELRLSFDLFDATLRGFDRGHPTRGGDGAEIFLDAVAGSKARQHVARAIEIWTPYRALVLDVLGADTASLSTVLTPAARHARQHNLDLLAQMNHLTTELELLTQREAASIRLYQGTAFLLALLNFFGALALYQRRIREASRQHGLLDDIIDKVSTGVLVLDGEANWILKANHGAEQLFGYDKAELTAMRVGDLIKSKDGGSIGRRKDGSAFIASVERNEGYLDERRMFVDTVIDVTEQRQVEEQLSGLAYHDLLTHLPNRALFDDRLRVEIAHAQRRQLKLGVLFIDLDMFKPINDTYGHGVGDLLLQAIAVRLRNCLRESDTIARRGGDEFTAIINDIASRDDCAKVAEGICAQLDTPFLVQGQELRISASIGISLYPDDGEEAQQLIDRADAAMYRAKQLGHGKYSFYSEARASG